MKDPCPSTFPVKPVPAPVAAAATSTSHMYAELQQRLDVSVAQVADIQAAMQGLRATSVPQLDLGGSTLIPAWSFRPRCLCLTPLPCVVGPLILPSSCPTRRSRRRYERCAQEAALRSDLCRVQHSLNDDILTDKETEDLHRVQQLGLAQLETFQLRDSQRRSLQWQELSPGGLSASIVFQQNVNKPTSHLLVPLVEETVRGQWAEAG